MRRWMIAPLLLLPSCDSCTTKETAADAGAILEASPPNNSAQAETIVVENCGVCHTLDMIHSQRLTRAQWEKELKKMSGWGALVTDEQRPIVLDWLTATDGKDAAAPVFLTASVADITNALSPAPGETRGDATRGKPKYEQLCQSCHGEGAKGAPTFGQRLVGRPVVWRTADFDKVVKEGRNRMPAQASNLDDAARADVLAYLRSLPL